MPTVLQRDSKKFWIFSSIRSIPLITCRSQFRVLFRWHCMFLELFFFHSHVYCCFYDYSRIQLVISVKRNWRGHFMKSSSISSNWSGAFYRISFQSHSQFIPMEWRWFYYTNHIELVIIITDTIKKKLQNCLSGAVSMWKSIVPIVAHWETTGKKMKSICCYCELRHFMGCDRLILWMRWYSVYYHLAKLIYFVIHQEMFMLMWINVVFTEYVAKCL